ncbi:MAG: glycosyltransferase family 2 protein [Rhizobiales bacterium]|nr:glycosyltransferase family 2 protein [Hyphomicrobiales bacterium]
MQEVISPDASELDRQCLDLTIVIVSYNTREITIEAVESVVKHSRNLACELIVVDNQSSDGTVAELRQRFPDIKVISAGSNDGYARGNNIGIAQAHGRYVLVLNPDVLVPEDTLASAVAYMDAHPEVGCLGAHALLEDGSQDSTLFRYLGLHHIFWKIFLPSSILQKIRLFGDIRYAGLDCGKEQDVDIVAGCFMMVPWRVITEVGPMDDRFFMYSEESEWCWRIKQAGYAIRFHPDIKIMHYGAVSTGQMSPWKAEEIARSHVLFLRITRGAAVARAGVALMLCGDLLRGFLVLPMALAGNRARFLAWRARAVFLIQALFRLPEGQVLPSLHTGSLAQDTSQK